MPAEPTPEPQEVVDRVERYVSAELADARKYENRSPLDDSGVFNLHRLAAAIYALGYAAGDFAADTRARGARQREWEAERG